MKRVLVAVVAAALLATPAAAAPVLGSAHWPTVNGVATVQVFDSTNDVRVGPALQEALATWSALSPDVEFVYNVGCSYETVYQTVPATGTNAALCVYIDETPYAASAYSYYPGDWICCTSNLVFNQLIAIARGTVDGWDYPSKVWLFKHELGHALGLAHEFGSGSLMDYAYPQPSALDPNADELATVHSIYAAGNIYPPTGKPCKGKKCR